MENEFIVYDIYSYSTFPFDNSLALEAKAAKYKYFSLRSCFKFLFFSEGTNILFNNQSKIST